MKTYWLSESEEIVMKAIWAEWDGESPLAARQFIFHFVKKGLKPSIVFIFLKRLEAKGFIRAECSPKCRSEVLYFPLISRDEWRYTRTCQFIQKLYGNLISHFVNNPNATPAEIEELQNTLDDFKRKCLLL
ncbi:MAG: BlaI/MecI/CopY family transcriptional regulator [Candidatus Pelethousia sp.]|nr:BlaI/MecI/CopY family transcriptional regulator [Candidatus Pelethousia sp.]